MRLNLLVQLRDCVVELLDVNVVNHALSQASYILRNIRRLLVHGGTSMEVQGICVSKLKLTIGLIVRFESAFGPGIKAVNLRECGNRELTVQSLEDIFEITCFQNAFDSPIVLCATYMSLCKIRIYILDFPVAKLRHNLRREG